MAYKALYRQYRPQSFSEVVGQKAIVETLKNSILNERISQAYLFCGPRGTGKTTIARIFAKAVNCNNFNGEPCNTCDNCKAISEGNHPDITEIDAASNNGVDSIRDLIEKVKYTPIQSRYKIYIIDEVHMLSIGAFNALLKTLEEPPEYVIFILATTDPQKVPSTIISRCQRYNFSRLSENDLSFNIKRVCDTSGIEIEDKAIGLIARLADGGMRDALSILDQCISYSNGRIMVEQVIEIYGLLSTSDIVEIMTMIRNNDKKNLFETIDKHIRNGADLRKLTDDLMIVSKEALIYKFVDDPKSLSRLNEKEANEINLIFGRNDLVKIIDIMLDTISKYKHSDNVTAYFEVAILKACNLFQGLSSPSIETSIKENIKEEIKPKEVEEKKTEVPGSLNTLDSVKDYLETNLGIKDIELESEPEIVSRETSKNNDIDDELVLGILADAVKTIKEQDIQRWTRITNYQNSLDRARYVSLLNGTSIFASTPDSVIIAALTKEQANEINNAYDDMNFIEFISLVLGCEKEVCAITQEETTRIRNLFIERKNKGTLPSKDSYKEEDKLPNIEIENSEEEADPVKQKLNSLFGKGNYDEVA